MEHTFAFVITYLCRAVVGFFKDRGAYLAALSPREPRPNPYYGWHFKTDPNPPRFVLFAKPLPGAGVPFVAATTRKAKAKSADPAPLQFAAEPPVWDGPIRPKMPR